MPNEQTKKILLDAFGIKKIFCAFNASIEPDCAYFTGAWLGNIKPDNLSDELRLLRKELIDYQFKERETLDVMAVAFYAWNDGDYENGRCIMPAHEELSHVEVLSVESYIMPVFEPDDSGIPF